MSLIVGDIGGTHSRFALSGGSPEEIGRIEIEDDDDHASFADAVAAYLEKTGEKPGRAVFAVAAPVSSRRVRLTNRDWVIDADELEKALGFERVALVNDFVAQAASLPHLGEGDLRPIGEARPADDTKAALGPGTGLGVAALARDGSGWLPLPSEGGHVDLAPADEREDAAWAIMRRDLGRVKAEHVLSGPGLARLHAALLESAGEPVETLAPPDVVARAKDGDVASRRTVDVFARTLARFSGDVALMFGARGGIYLCGGIMPKILDLIDLAAFRSAFEAKPPHEEMMRKTATSVVTSPIAGLIGCAAIAKTKI